MPRLRCGRFALDLDRPLVMGIVNLTPDSFSGDGAVDVGRAIDHAKAQWEAGADILDLGAESSRPGAESASLDEELRRLMPVLDAVVQWGVPVSIDTYKPEVMAAALAAGADLVNDIYGLRMPGALDAVASSNAAVCVMHMQGEPLTMQREPVYGDVVAEVVDFLGHRVDAAIVAGIDPERIVVDPGFGFGKTLAHNLELFRALPAIVARGFPVLAGVSRKSMLGAITGRLVGDRLAASVAGALLAAEKGAKILRVHDVAATRDALAVLAAVNGRENS